MSASILLIIGFLIHVKNIKSGTDQLKIKIREKDSKKVTIYVIKYRKEARGMLTPYFSQGSESY